MPVVAFSLACGQVDVHLVPGGQEPGVGDAGLPLLPSNKDGGACVGRFFESEPQMFGIYIMMDRSASMAEPVGTTGESRWAVVAEALRDFVAAPESRGLHVGLQYFARQTLSLQNPFSSSCDPFAYASPDVELLPLPDNAEAITASLEQMNISALGSIARREQYLFETPTDQALSGAIMKVAAWKNEHPGAGGAVLLVTDGEPQSSECGSNLPSTVAAAEQGVTAGIVTFVLGVGPSLSSLQQIAIAGGTSRAYLTPTDVTSDVIAALDSIREDALPCSLSLLGVPFTPGELNVVVRDPFGEREFIASVGDAGCNGQPGWYFDSELAPTHVELCELSCRDVRQRPNARIELLTGCPVITR